MSETLTRREAILERAIEELLDCVPHSRDSEWAAYYDSKVERLRAEADLIEKRDNAVKRARELIAYDPLAKRALK